MENFDALSNDEIREQLKKFSLPIIPVTSTTRKLLIKRLVEASSGGAPKANNKARRETVNVPKPSVADDSESDADSKRPSSKPKPSNRRATIAAPLVPQPVVVEKPSKPKPIAAVVAEKLPTLVTPAKKTGRTTPSVPKPTVADIPDQSDDDVVAPPAAKPNRRTSRSPSLGKSTVVTTSYKHTIEPLHEQSIGNDVNDVILVNDDDSDPGVDEFFTNNGKGKDFTTSTLRSTSSGDNNVLRRTTLDTFRTTIAPGPTLISEYRDQAKESIAASESLFRRRYTTNTPVKPSQELNTGDAGNDDPLKKVETPFLSDFTRRLAQLKAEPLANLNNSFGYDEKSGSSGAAATATSPTGYREERDYYRQSYAGRPSVGRGQYARPARAMAEVPQEPSAWKKIEAKIRWPLLALFGSILFLFVFVVLFTN